MKESSLLGSLGQVSVSEAGEIFRKFVRGPGRIHIDGRRAELIRPRVRRRYVDGSSEEVQLQSYRSASDPGELGASIVGVAEWERRLEECVTGVLSGRCDSAMSGPQGTKYQSETFAAAFGRIGTAVHGRNGQALKGRHNAKHKTVLPMQFPVASGFRNGSKTNRTPDEPFIPIRYSRK